MKHSKRINKKKPSYLLYSFISLFLVLLIGLGFILYKRVFSNPDSYTSSTSSNPTDEPANLTIEDTTFRKNLLEKAELLAKGYDYDGAIKLIKDNENYQDYPDLTVAIDNYNSEKSTLVQADITKIDHAFFHPLVYDTTTAWSSDMASAYNCAMTTTTEFTNMMQQMYDKGYVLVSMHDMATVNSDGKMTQGKIMLPKGKIPFVLSVDDVNYYRKWYKKGIADKLIVGEDGLVTCEATKADGSKITGAFDVAPLLDEFIAKHPDFSYKGARGILAVTGYEGIYGYRTSARDSENTEPIESEKEKVIEVIKALAAGGWDFASHSWGHLDLKSIPYEKFKADTDRWETEVRPIFEAANVKVDIILYPFGADVGSWQTYVGNERFNYLKSKGFSYFCNVDCTQPWVQFNGDAGYLRQGRINLDGYNMKTRPNSLTKYFDVNSVIDKTRPDNMDQYGSY